jgi:hypothetical protein
LKANKVVVDMAEHSIVTKPSSYVLLDSSSLVVRRPPLYSQPANSGSSARNYNYGKFRQVQVSNCHKLFAKVFLELKRKVQLIQPIEVHFSLSVLHNRIAVLAAETHRLRHHRLAKRQLKSEFKDVAIESYLVRQEATHSGCASSAALLREDVRLKTEFADLFPDQLPHVDSLPTDI